MAQKKTTKKKTTKKKKVTRKKSSGTKTKSVAVSTDNIKSFMKMNADMETAIYGFAGELKINQKKEITPTQLLSQSLKYLKCYAESNNLNLSQASDKVSSVDKDYSVSSSDEIKIMRKQIAASKKLDRDVTTKMRQGKIKRTAVRSAAGKTRKKRVPKQLPAKTE